MRAFTRLCVLITFLLGSFHAFPQRCAEQEYKSLLLQRNPQRETLPQFENWLKKKLESPQYKNQRAQRTESATYTIPVVVHIIHNGEAIGTGTNISDAQVISQIGVLNKDFKRMNADAAQTPSIFQPVAGMVDVEFVLAKQDPEGLETNGIRRVQGTKTSWKLADNNVFKGLSYWPAEDYLNIWVINFNDPAGYIGYAQFPVSTLPGLEDSSNDALTDGVVVHYRAFGSVDDEPTPNAFNLESQFNKGRTATHEVGHFFGLHHIWGNSSSCSGTDYVDDTPPQAGSTNGCPTHPQTSCSNTKMFQNYMDYTNDVCMNLYTQGQVGRMEIVLQNSPRRLSLTTSPGASAPVPVANDLGIKEIVAPAISACGGTTLPSVEVRNYGSNTVTSARVVFRLNGSTVQTKDFVLNLAPLEQSILTFNNISLISPSVNSVEFEITQTNGTTDGKIANNSASHTATVPYSDTVPVTEIFNSVPTKWKIENPDGQTTWAVRNAPKDSPINSAIFLSMHDYENEGTFDRLITPSLDFTNVTSALLQFDYAYAKFPNYDNDELKIVVTTNCTADFTQGTVVFSKSGSALSTTSNTSTYFVPSGASQWKTESIPMTQFSGFSNVQIAIIAKNGHGNNLYVDNFFVLAGEFDDANLIAINSPSPVIDKFNPAPKIQIKNIGSVTLNEITATATVNSAALPSQQFSGLQLSTGEETELTLNPISLVAGINQITIALTSPNGKADNTPENNSMTLTVVVNTNHESIPTRQGFDVNFFDNWTAVAQGTYNWEIMNTNKDQSLEAPGFDNGNVGEEAWLVSPVLDFSKAGEAALFFDLSYGKSSKGNDRLRVVSSVNGGETFTATHYDQSGQQMSVATSSGSWLPLTDTDWRRDYVNLNSLAGKSGVRLAFVATNDNGNNIYIDNVELFNDDDPDPPAIEDAYRIYTVDSQVKVVFNLMSKAAVRLQVYNMVGQQITDNLLPGILNQTFTVDLSGQNTGIYIVRLQFPNEVQSTKVFVVN